MTLSGLRISQTRQRFYGSSARLEQRLRVSRFPAGAIMKRIVSYNDSLAFVAEIQSELSRRQKHTGEERTLTEASTDAAAGNARSFSGTLATAPEQGAVASASSCLEQLDLQRVASEPSPRGVVPETHVERNTVASEPAKKAEPPAAEGAPATHWTPLSPAQQTKPSGSGTGDQTAEASGAFPTSQYDTGAAGWRSRWNVGSESPSLAPLAAAPSPRSFSNEREEDAVSADSSLLAGGGRVETERTPVLAEESFPLAVDFDADNSSEAYGGIQDAFIDRHRAARPQHHRTLAYSGEGEGTGTGNRLADIDPGASCEPPQHLATSRALPPDSRHVPEREQQHHEHQEQEQCTLVEAQAAAGSMHSGTGDEVLAASSTLRRIESQGKRVSSALDLPEMAKPAGQTKYMVRKLVIVMAGLPARGKSHIAQQVARYLNWLGHRTAIFNVGVMRRRLMKSSDCDASFFSPENDEGMRLRWEFARRTLHEMNQWLFGENGQVGIYDATNSTKMRRRFVREYLENLGIRVLFLESIVNDERIVEQNILATKLNSPDYRDRDADYAVRDFKNRLRNYERANETITEDEGCSYVKIIDGGKKFVLYNLKGHLQSKIVSYLTSVHIVPRLIYLSRHGESEWNVTGQLGGDPPITRRGEAYAKRLSEFLQREFQGRPLPTVWCSQLRRTWLTVRHIPTDICICWRSLNEINAGICEGMTYEQIKRELPDVWEARKADKLRYRYPSGESYLDVIHRVEPIILEIERQTKPLLIVAHNAIIRSIYAFFKGLKQEQVPYVDIPLHTLICLRTRPYGCDERRYKLLTDEVPIDRARTPEPSDSEGHPRDHRDAAEAAPNCAVIERVWFDDIETIP
jgi:6-phosphofructo-2-kinase/fructose-2,6-biphosphatase